MRACGTEGRLAALGRPYDEMPGSENRYESIVFRAADVKDLTIDDPNPEPAQPAQPAFQDPAIIGVRAAAESALLRDADALPIVYERSCCSAGPYCAAGCGTCSRRCTCPGTERSCAVAACGIE